MHTILPFLSSELKVITAVYGALTLRLLFLSLVHLPARRGGRCHSFTTTLGLREGRCPKQGRSAGTASTPGLNDPEAQEFPSPMALGRMLSHHLPLILRLAERAEPVCQGGKRLGQSEGQARRVTPAWGIWVNAAVELLQHRPAVNTLHFATHFLLHVHKLLSMCFQDGCYLGTA